MAKHKANKITAPLLLFIVIGAGNLFAQKRVIDSLYKIITPGLHDSVKVKLYCELSKTYSYTYSIKADTLYNGIVVAKLAKEYALKSDKKYYAAEALFHAGNICFRLNKPDNALEFFLEAVNYANEIKSDKLLARIYNNAGMVHQNYSKNYKKSREYFLKALAINQKLGNKKLIGGNLGNISMTYNNSPKMDLDSALYYSLKCYEVLCESGDTSRIAMAAGNLAEAYIDMFKYDKAFEYIQISKFFHQKLDERSGVAYNNHRLGKLYCKTKKYNEAEPLLILSYEYGKNRKDYILQQSSAETLSDLYKKINKLDKALFFQNEYYVLKDTISNQEKLNKIDELESDYTIKNIERENEMREKVSALKHEEENQRKMIIIWFGTAMLAVTVIFSFFIYNRFRLTQKQKMIIENQKKEVEIKNEIIEEKQKALIDSINYAKRIQDSLLPKEKYIERIMKKNK
jgi:tetratricopeptide (TPR) repeat protein